MHFLGLRALSPFEAISIEFSSTVYALVGGTLFATSAMFCFSRSSGRTRIFGASALIVAAILTLHLTSMGGTQILFAPDQGALPATLIGRNAIATAVSVISGVLIAVSVGSVVLDRHLTDLKGLAEATFEGIVISRDDLIIECNDIFARASGVTTKGLKGRALSSILTPTSPQDELSAFEGILRTSGATVPVEILARQVEYRGQLSTITAVRDISERLEANARLEQLSRLDPLTGLVNRRQFDRDFSSTLQAAQGKRVVAVLALDLDRFKLINDLYGHAEGDAVLRRVADLLTRCVGPNELVARLGGDEFCVVLRDAPNREFVRAYANKILRAFETEFQGSETSSSLGVSIGVSLFPDDGSTVRSLLNNADTALYESKTAGRAQVSFFQPLMDYRLRAKRGLERQLKTLSQTDQLFLEYQPITRLDGELSGYEALLRWRHPQRGILYPSAFVREARETGAIIDIGMWEIEAACREASQWKQPVYVSLNITAEQLRAPGFSLQVLTILRKTGLPPEHLNLEVKETALLHDHHDVKTTLQNLRNAGVKIALDHFGAGYSSLTTLRTFPFDKLKIDSSLLSGTSEDPRAEAVFDLILNLASRLSLPVIVNEIETAEQLAFVSSRRPGELQGSLVGKPQIAPTAIGRRDKSANTT